MSVVTMSNGALTVKAYAGDARTLLAFNLTPEAAAGLAGFTIQCAPEGHAAYYLFNTLQFETPGNHTQDANEPPYSSINAPIHKFRWVHIPGSAHQGLEPFFGPYTYTVTPRYFDANQSLRPLDASLSVSPRLDVTPFTKGALAVGFTRGFVQSQAFLHHFGHDAILRPAGDALLYSTAAQAGTNPSGQVFTFADEYAWSGFTARRHVFDLLDAVVADPGLRLDMFAYDLNEPDILDRLLTLASEGRVRLILDNASLHHSATTPTSEDQFEALFNQKKTGTAAILRGHYDRYAHNKVMVVSDATGPRRVLTGSTNFSITGLYVNSNHVLVFDDVTVAKTYADLFEEVWLAGAKSGTFQKSPRASQIFGFGSPAIPATEITFAPHPDAFAQALMEALTERINQEGKDGSATGSVLFAVMDTGSGDGPVRPALIVLHDNQSIFSYGISDSSKGILLYSPKKKTGVLVTGKPLKTTLPPPFDQVASPKGHQVHHKFVVCGFNTPGAVVYCGSSNLANGGETSNGDNLLAIRDPDVATAFAIEALGLIDHFEFLDRFVQASPVAPTRAPASKQAAALDVKWFLSTTDAWARPYFDPNDLHCVDRELFG